MRPHRLALPLSGASLLALFALASAAGAQAAPQRTPEEEYGRLQGIQAKVSAPTLEKGEGVTAQDVVFRSATLDREMRCRVLLPASYGRSHRYYPVLYLLHGYMNPFYEWDKQTSLARVLEREGYELVVVLPQMDNSFYLNAESGPQDAYQTYFFRDLLPSVEARFRVRSEPPARAVAGVSMGGYGAFLYAFKAPRSFAFAASLSGSVDFVRQAEGYAKALAPYPLEALLGQPGSETRKQNDLFELVQSVDPATLPPLWITVGGQDFLLEENLAFLKVLHERSIAVDFHTAPGEHEWVYWDAELPALLRAVGRALGVEAR